MSNSLITNRIKHHIFTRSRRNLFAKDANISKQHYRLLNKWIMGPVILVLSIFVFQTVNSHRVFALYNPPNASGTPITNLIPSDVQFGINHYDSPSNSSSECLANPSQEYDVVNWISVAGQPTNDQTITLDSSGTANLQLNEVIFSCHVIQSPNTTYAPTDSLPGSGNDLNASGEEVASSRVTVDSGPGGGKLSNFNLTQLSVNHSSSSRYWFATPKAFTYSNPGLTASQTVTINMNVISINQFSGFFCVAYGGVINPGAGENHYPPTSITDFGACDSLPAYPIQITFNPTPPNTITLHGTITNNGAAAPGVLVQACDCGGYCQGNDTNAPKGSGTTGSTGQYSLITDINKDLCISVASGAPPGTCTLNQSASYAPYRVGCEYEIKPVPAGLMPNGWTFNYGSIVPPPQGNISGNCSQSSSAVSGDFYTAAQPPSPSDTVTFEDNEGRVTAPANVSPDTSTRSDVLTGSYSYGTTNNLGPVPFTTMTGPYSYTITSKWKNNTTDKNGVVTHYYTVTSYQEEFTHWTFTLGLPSSSVVQFSLDPVNISDSYGASSTFSPQSECDPNPPSISSGGFSCSARNVSYSASDPDAAFSSGDITYTVDGGGSQVSNSSPIDMSSYDQLVSHTVVITVQDVNIFGAAANGAGWEAVNGPTSVTIDYPPCYQATCGSASVPGVVQVNSQFSVTITLGFIQLNGAGPPPPSAMGGTLSDNFLGQTGSINNTYQLVSVFTAPATGGDETLTWTYNDPGGVGLPISCNTDVVIADEPYLRSYGGDVTDGQGFATSTGTCTNNSNASVLAWNGGPLGAYTGAGVQFAALAIGNIKGFASSDGAKAGVPVGLSFGNTGANPAADNYGGGYQGYTPCIPDYYDAAVSSNTTVHNFIGPITISNGILPDGTSVENVSSPTVVKVKGNVTITNSGPSINKTGPWVNSGTKTVTTYPTPLAPSYINTPGAPIYTDSAASVPAGQYGFLWTYAAGTPSGQALINNNNYHCVNVTEPSDPIWTGAYDDNYLCVPKSTDMNILWTWNRSAPPGYNCLSVNPPWEPAQHYWSDNELCYNGQNRNLTISYTGPMAGAYCTQMNEPGDSDGPIQTNGQYGWENLYLCEPLAGQQNLRPVNSVYSSGGQQWTYVAGRVTYADGQPIAGVVISFCDWGYSGTYGVVTGTTNANGYYESTAPFLVSSAEGATLCARISGGNIPVGSPTAINLPYDVAGSGSYECNYPGINEYQSASNACGGPNVWDINADDYYDFTFPSPPGTTTTQVPNTDSLAIPSLYLIAEGNIYIDPSVKSLDGIYVAQFNGTNGGSIYTCNNGNTHIIASGNPGYYAACSGDQLIVNGAFVANKIVLGRAYSSADTGAQGDTSASPGTGWNNAAEVFNYTPADWLGNPFSETTNTYDAITSLPPVL